MCNWLRCYKEANSETKQFVITVIVLAVIVFGTFFYAFWRVDDVRSGKNTELISK